MPKFRPMASTVWSHKGFVGRTVVTYVAITTILVALETVAAKISDN